MAARAASLPPLPPAAALTRSTSLLESYPAGTARSSPPPESEAAMERAAFAEFLAKTPSFANQLAKFSTKLKRRDFSGTQKPARETIVMVRMFLQAGKWNNGPLEMIKLLRGLGRYLILTSPFALVVACMVRRVLFLLREEITRICQENKEDALRARRQASAAMRSGGSTVLSLESLRPSPSFSRASNTEYDSDNASDHSSVRLVKKSQVTQMTQIAGSATLWGVLSDQDDTDIAASVAAVHDKSVFADLKKTLANLIDDLAHEELESVHEPIAKIAPEYIHAKEVVLVYGFSDSVLAFLKGAYTHKRTDIEVFVAETSNGYKGHEMALSLSKFGINTTVINDGAIFALMARVNKVLIGAHAVMANGGILAECGVNLVAAAAKHHAIPVVCITGLYKLCPLYPFSQESFNELVSPGALMSYEDFSAAGDVRVVSPAFDYVSSEYVSLFLTDSGAHTPSYIYRLLAEMYSPLDSLTEDVPQLTG